MADNGLLGSLLGFLSGNSQQKWDRNALVNVLNTLNQANSFGTQYGRGFLDPAGDAAKELLTRAGMFTWGNDGNPGALSSLGDRVNSTYQNLTPGQFAQNVIQQNPGMFDSTMQGMQGAAGQAGGLQDVFSKILAQGGRTEDGQNLSARLFDLINGQGAQLQGMGDQGFKMLMNPSSQMTRTMQGVGSDAAQNGGFNSGLESALAAALGISNAGGTNGNIDAGISNALRLAGGGNTAGLDALRKAGLGGLTSNLGVAGLTPTGAQGETTALQGLQNGGATGFTQFMQNRGAQLAGQDAVLPTLLAMDMARGDAATQYQHAAEKARSQALAHGGGGSVVANGTANDAMSEFADQAAQGISKNVTDTLFGQQGLGLQQQAQGANMGLQAAGQETTRLNNFGNLLQGLEDVATRRYGVGGGLLAGAEGQATQNQGVGLGALSNFTGQQSDNVLKALGLVPGIQNAATNNAGTLGGLGLGAGQLDLGTAQAGGNLLNQFNQLRLGGMNSLTGLLGQENQYNLGAGGLVNQAVGNQGSILNNLFGNQLAGQQLGMSQTNSFYQTLSDLMRNQLGVAGLGTGLFQTGLGSLGNSGNTAFGYAQTGLGGQAGLFGRGTSQGNNGAIGLGNAAGSIGDLISILGGL
jgi:hypothetical protein